MTGVSPNTDQRNTNIVPTVVDHKLAKKARVTPSLTNKCKITISLEDLIGDVVAVDVALSSGFLSSFLP